ncbi:MAG: DUF211 domain-containing protein [Candidatus Helarchaeota archaeon]
MSIGIKRLVLDVLKPHNPNLPYLANQIAKIPGINGVNISLMEIDKETESIKLTIEGDNLIFEELKEKLEEWNCAIHSVDQVVAGKKVIEEVPTHQE